MPATIACLQSRARRFSHVQNPLASYPKEVLIENNVLSFSDIAHFDQHGYIYFPAAFSRTDALTMQDILWTQMREQNKIERDKRSTWPAGAWSGVKDHASLERGIATPRLCGAINQLIGEKTWHIPDRWGGYLITFPTQVSQAWELTSKDWHWDDTLINHFGLRNTGLFIFTLLADLKPRGGGTLLVSGSHRLIEQFFHRLSPEDQRLKQKLLKSRFALSHPWLVELTSNTDQSPNRIQRFMQETTEVDKVPVKVVQVTGEAGDAYLCHPAIFHTASPNHADVPRFMRVKGLLKQLSSSL